MCFIRGHSLSQLLQHNLLDWIPAKEIKRKSISGFKSYMDSTDVGTTFTLLVSPSNFCHTLQEPELSLGMLLLGKVCYLWAHTVCKTWWPLWLSPISLLYPSYRTWDAGSWCVCSHHTGRADIQPADHRALPKCVRLKPSCMDFVVWYLPVAAFVLNTVVQCSGSHWVLGKRVLLSRSGFSPFCLLLTKDLALCSSALFTDTAFLALCAVSHWLLWLSGYGLIFYWLWRLSPVCHLPEIYL